jgi:hypothetical protein
MLIEKNVIEESEALLFFLVCAVDTMWYSGLPRTNPTP